MGVLVLVFEVIIDPLLIVLGEPMLRSVVVVPEVMAIACRLIVESKWVIGRIRAAVRCPNQIFRPLKVSVFNEFWKVDIEED